MVTIESAEELAAVSGGVDDNPLHNIKCTVSVSPTPLSCTGSLDDFRGLVVAAFNGLQGWGTQLGGWIYETTHKK
jgi:hypothetical protein